MRRMALLLTIPLAACATERPAIPVRGETAGRACVIGAVDSYIGSPASAALGTELLAKSNAAVLRWVPVGTMITQDFRADRLTVRLGPDNRVMELRCG